MAPAGAVGEGNGKCVTLSIETIRVRARTRHLSYIERAPFTLRMGCGAARGNETAVRDPLALRRTVGSELARGAA